MSEIEQKRAVVGLSLVAAEQVQEAYTIFSRAWGLLRNFYNISEYDEQAWEVAAKEAREIGNMGKTETEHKIAVKIGIMVYECLEIISKYGK